MPAPGPLPGNGPVPGKPGVNVNNTVAANWLSMPYKPTGLNAAGQYVSISSTAVPGTFTNYCERNDPASPIESWVPGVSKVTRKLFTASPSRLQAYCDILGFPSYIQNGAGPNYLSRNLPTQVFAWGGIAPQAAPSINNLYPLMYASAIPHVEQMQPNQTPPGLLALKGGTAPSADVARYTLAEMTVEYTRRTFAVLPDSAVLGAAGTPWAGIPDESSLLRYVTRQPKSSSRALSLPASFACWVPQSAAEAVGGTVATKINEGIVIPVPEMSLTITWHTIPLPAIPWQAIQACQGAVNATVLDPYGINIPPGCAMLDSPEYVIGEDPIIGLIADVRYPFKIRWNVDSYGIARGWRWGYRRWTDGGGAHLDMREQAVYDSSGTVKGNNVLRVADFNALFRPA